MASALRHIPNALLSRVIRFLDVPNLLEFMLVSWNHYTLAAPSAYRYLRIIGTLDFQALRDMLSSSPTASKFVTQLFRPCVRSDVQTWTEAKLSFVERRRLALSFVRQLVLSVRPPPDLVGGPVVAPDQAPTMPQDDHAHDSEASVDHTTDPPPMGGDMETTSPAGRSDSLGSERGPDPDDDAYMLQSASTLRGVFVRLYAGRKKLFEDAAAEQGGLTHEQAAAFDPPYPFYRTTHLVLTTLTYPARGATAAPTLLAPFRSVRDLTICSALGNLTTQVWHANLRELWQCTPYVQRVTFVCENNSLFNSKTVHFHRLPMWPYLECIRIDLSRRYKSTLGGDVWHFGEEIGSVWVHRILAQLKRVLVHFYKHKPHSSQQNANPTPSDKIEDHSLRKRRFGIVLLLPETSQMTWDYQALVHSFTEAQNAPSEHIFFDVSLVFGEAFPADHDALKLA